MRLVCYTSGIMSNRHEEANMTRGLIFWVLMLIWFVFALVINFGGPMMGGYAHGGEIANTFLFLSLIHI